MEDWQKSVIQQHLPELIQNIECNVLLMSYLCKNVLSKPDKETIEAKGGAEGNLAKVDKLLQILETRKKAYECLSHALYNCNQTAAWYILLRGAEESLPESNPFQICEIKINVENIFAKEIMFEDVKLSVNNFFSVMNETKFQTIIENFLDVASYRKLVNSSDDNFCLAVNTIKDRIPYYIERLICQQNILDPTIFDQLKDDVFLIEGIEYFQLTNLASGNKNGLSDNYFKLPSQETHESRESRRNIKKQAKRHIKQPVSVHRGNDSLTDKSSNQIRGQTVRFILLEEHEHFFNIQQISQKILHWIRYDNGSFRYLKSSKSSGIIKIRKYITSKQEIMSENEFVELCLCTPKNQPIIIYDSPGMGKTTLMKELATKVKQLTPQSNVIFLTVSDFVSLFDPEIKLGSQIIKSILVQAITTTKLAQSIQAELFNSPNHSVELFLDSFDELDKENVTFAKTLLVYIFQNMTNVRMYITTRPHKNTDLDDIFNVLGFNILPFQEENQISFILKFWQNCYNISVNDKCEEVARNSLRKFTGNLSSRERQLAGIPLQCRMLAEIFYSDVNKKHPEYSSAHVCIDSIYKMFKCFIEKKFDDLDECSGSVLALYDFHIKSAVQLLFSRKINLIMPDVSLETVYSIGIMEFSASNPQQPKFVHRSFADYLAAECIVEWFQGGFPENGYGNKSFTSFLVNDVFAQKNTFKVGNSDGKKFCNSNIIGFLDCSLTENYHTAPNNSIKNALNNEPLTSTTILDLIKASLEHNSVSLLNFILDNFLCHKNFCSYDPTNKSLLFQFPTRASCIFLAELFENIEIWKDAVSIATKRCSLSVVKRICKFFTNATGLVVSNLEYKLTTAPIYYSLRRGNYHIFEYMLNECGIDYLNSLPVSPLRLCMLHSYHAKSESDINDKIQIMKLILSELPQQLNADFDEHPPILAYEAHPQLIKCLLDAEADVFATTVSKHNIAHRTANYFTAEEYHEFIELLVSLESSKGTQIVKTLFDSYDSVDMCTPVYTAVLNLELLPRTLELLKFHGVNFDKIIKENCSVLHAAVHGKRSADFIKFLIEERVCNVSALDKYGNTFVHLLAASYDEIEFYEIVDYLCSHGHSNILFNRNEDMCRPLEIAVTYMNISEDILCLFKNYGVDLNSVNKDNMTLLMIAVDSKRSINIVKTLVKMNVDVMVEDVDGYTVAHFAAERYSKEAFHEFVIYFIKENFGSIFLKANKYEETPLHLAISHFEVLSETLNLLATDEKVKTQNQMKNISIGPFVNFNSVDENGDSILHYAVESKRSLNLIKELVALGADYSIKNQRNSNLAHESAAAGLLEHLKYFVEMGCNINDMDNDGDTLLHCALDTSEKNLYEIVKFLIEKGANISSQNKDGKTAYMLAMEEGTSDERVVNLLK